MKDDLWILAKKCESPAEIVFLTAAYERIEGLIPQYVVPRYRLDFAVPDKLIAIEIDGHDYHKTKNQRTYDAKRDRELSIGGWKVVRFTASEIFQNAPGCVDDILRLIAEIDPKGASYWFNEGITLVEQGKYDDAIIAFDRAIEIDPQLAEAWSNKGNALVEQGMYDDAIIAFDKAIEINPHLDRIRLFSGVLARIL